MEDGLDEVLVDYLKLHGLHGLLLRVQRRQVLDLLRLVKQRLHDAEEEGA